MIAIVLATIAVVPRGGHRLASTTPPKTAKPTVPTAPPRGSAVESRQPSTSSTTAAGALAPSSPAATGGPITIAFAGDIHFEKGLRTALDAGPSKPLAGVQSLLSEPDLTVANLETAVTGRGDPAPGKQFHFRAPAAAFGALAASGIDVVSMANNHGMDYGMVGLADSLDAAAAAHFPVIGIGRDEDQAYAPYIATIRGQRVAVIAATQVLDANLVAAWTAGPAKPGLASAKRLDRLVEAVRAARAIADTVVVFLHWGTEGQTCPNADQPPLEQALADAGADVVVGSHAHRLLGAGFAGHTFVAYGLGNFAFYASGGPGTETGVLALQVQGRNVVDWRWSPAKIVGQLPRALAGTEATTAHAAFMALEGCARLTPRPG